MYQVLIKIFSVGKPSGTSFLYQYIITLTCQKLTHVRIILEAPTLKIEDGKELRRLHNTVLQHIRTLKAMSQRLQLQNHQRVNSKNFHADKPLPSFATTTDNSEMAVRVLCKPEKHLLLNCIKFKELPHEGKLSVLKTHNQYNNCLRAGHYACQCKSVHRCKKCHGQHHTL